jgi:hypothetical protein
MQGMTALLLVLGLLAGAPASFAEDSAPAPPTAEEVLDGLKRTIAWSQQARAAMQTAKEAAVVLAVREDDRTIVAALQRAFEAARAEAALVEQASASASASPGEETPAARRAERRAKLEAAIRANDAALARLRERGRSAPPAQRDALARDVKRTEKRLAVDRLRLELLTGLQQAEASLVSGAPDLMQEIQALQETVPELAPASAKSAAPAVTPPPPSNGTWSATHRLVALQRARNSLGQLAWGTQDLEADVDARAQRVRDALRARSRELRTLVAGPGADGAETVAESEFRRELDTLKQLGGALVPLRAEAALLQRFEGDIRAWQRTVDRESRMALQDLGLGLVGLVIGAGAIVIGAFAWRMAVNRYVKDPYRRRLLLRARKVVIAVAFVLLLVFHFTSELTALVTALGFAAAGIAFALQNVILALAGYFSMVAPNGIRVGDRVSLQGPFGYVHGEVIEIGLVRLRLRELTADRLEPTGRIVVFSNSVVFTGSFFKDPPPEAKAA